MSQPPPYGWDQHGGGPPHHQTSGQAPMYPAAGSGGMTPSAMHYPPPEEMQDPIDYTGDPENVIGQKGPRLIYDDQSVHRAFVRKVYAILTVMLLVVVAMIAVCLYVPEVKETLQKYYWLYYVSYFLNIVMFHDTTWWFYECGVFLAVYIPLVCCPIVHKKFPYNIILTAILTLAIGFMTAMMSSYHKTEIVLVAMGITAAVCIAITLFAINTKYDFTSKQGVVFAVFMVVFFFGIFAIIFRNRIMMAVYGGAMALVFMVFLAIDTQMVMRRGRKYELSEEDYIFAVIQLFLDIVYIFWNMLILSRGISGD